MAETKIEWATHTFNPWWGCTRVSPLCDNCYADTWARRTGHNDIWDTSKRRYFTDKHWNEPLKLNRKAEQEGDRPRVFCASMADVFDNQVPQEHRERLWTLIKETPSLDWLILTKRVSNIEKMLPEEWGEGYPNVWLGISVGTQEDADRDIPRLLRIPAWIHWLSMEPLLEAVDLSNIRYKDEDCLCKWDVLKAEHWVLNSMSPSAYCDECDGVAKLDWVVTGGESGPRARPSHPDWFRSLRDQCQAADVPFFFKQWGEYIPGDGKRYYHAAVHGGKGAENNLPGYRQSMVKVGKKKAGRILDGRTWDEYPA